MIARCPGCGRESEFPLKIILAGQLASEQDIQRFHTEVVAAAWNDLLLDFMTGTPGGILRGRRAFRHDSARQPPVVLLSALG